ncbi:LUD domain-containing protein [Pontibacter korlensis]|uniref:LUD domain-containing protein n=1 Tax=Pontibacter korlensis TaxID=400092 RepID=A0A0E3UV75_9BACT|nr:LUD domain-containing protein [Pontibacter korlensis]AKD02282.1 hypothetical protein PKOR_02960 [Pontibacter korlensis]
MSSREKILSRVKANKPPQVPLPEAVAFFTPPSEQWAALFRQSAEAAGSIVVGVPDMAGIGAYLKDNFVSPERILNTVDGVGFGLEVREAIAEGHHLANLELAVVEGQMGVAENGAIWVTEESVPARVLPFICEHLALVVRQQDIVGTMHEAYDRLNIAATGYGTFIAGPSRTADIEQSLVIGAHGPKRMHVFILDNQHP